MSLMALNNSIKRTVLVIEDNENNRDLLCALLEDQYNVLDAENGKIGLDIFKEHFREISVILLDMQMPVMNGYEFLEIVQNDQLMSNIPIIVVTATNTPDEEEKCLSLGASDFITKPYNRRIILHRINSVIKLRESVSTISAIEYDSTTGVYTRPAFIHHATQLLTENPEQPYTLLIAELEKSEDVMGKYDQTEVRKMMKMAAQKMREVMPTDYIGGRYGGTKMVCMGPYIPGTRPPEIRLKSKEGLVCVVKYGIVRDVDHNLSIMALCEQAELAIQGIQHQYGHYFAIFDERLQRKEYFRNAIEQNMANAVRENQFKVYYQPKHDIKTGKIAGAEALIRWIHPELGFISPADFIPVFEQTGFVVESDYYVWKRTVENLHRWNEQGLKIVPISVNCSQKGFADENMVPRWLETKQQTGVPEGSLHIEITESAFIGVVSEMAQKLQQLRDNDVQIELDDFGSGYSSLNMLGELPIDVAKLDMGFVSRIENQRKLKVMTACVNLIHDLKYKIVVEGVETEQQLQIAKNLGIDYAQGYYYSKPLAEEDFEKYLIEG